jgi:hypothetical protein
MTLCRTLRVVACVCLLCAGGCRRERSVALPPISEAPRVTYQEPSPEAENQATSTPVSVVDTLPKPAATSTDLKLNIPPPSSWPNPKPPTAAGESKRDTKATASEPKIVVQSPTIQLAPRISDRDRNDLIKKINSQLDSAKALIKSVNPASLGEEQKINLEAIQDFIKKSEESMTRGELTQGLVLAEKANTLAASLSGH